MAKLKAPLLSLGASGAIGKTLVFFPWKGLDVVREYVIPANPDTALQGIQRDYLKAAVALVHEAESRETHPLVSADQIAYSALASAKGYVMTWFNMAVKLYLDTILTKIGDSEVPCVYSGMFFDIKTTTNFHCHLYLNEEESTILTHGKFYFGASKTNLIHGVVANVFTGDHVSLTSEDLSAFLTAGKKYFVQFRPDADKPCEGADSGIYHFVAE